MPPKATKWIIGPVNPFEFLQWCKCARDFIPSYRQWWRSIVTAPQICQQHTARTCALRGGHAAALRSPAFALKVTWNETAESFGHPFFSHCSCLQKCMRNSWVRFKNLPKCSLEPDKYRNSKSLLSVPRNHSLPIGVCNPTPTQSQLQVS